MSLDMKDLRREIKGEFANLDCVSLKPDFKVNKPAEPFAGVEDYHPFGTLIVITRLRGVDHVLGDIIRCEYMKWAVMDSLQEALASVCRLRVKAQDIMFCMDEVFITETATQRAVDCNYQCATFRFDYRVMVPDKERAESAIRIAREQMVNFEELFCKRLEWKFRHIYHLTIIGLTNKNCILMDGDKMMSELRLFQAALAGNVEEIRSLINKGVKVDARQTLVAGLGSPKDCRFPCDILPEDEAKLFCGMGQTALLGAASRGNLEAVRVLLQSGAKHDLQDNDGWTALHCAAEVNAGPVIQALLALGANKNARSCTGGTPLHTAAASGASDCVRVLLQAHAEPNLKDQEGSAPVHLATVEKHTGVLDVMKECGVNLDAPSLTGNTAVHEAVMKNDDKTLKKLHELGANINIESGPMNDYQTPLRMANLRKKKKAAKELVKLGAVEAIEGHEFEESGEGEPRVRGRISKEHVKGWPGMTGMSDLSVGKRVA